MEVTKSCCARSQQKIFNDRIIFSAAARRDDQPFTYVAAIKRTGSTGCGLSGLVQPPILLVHKPDGFSVT